MFATCETEGCGNAYIPVELPPEYGDVFCGPCGNPVTLVKETAPSEPKEMPTWEIG